MGVSMEKRLTATGPCTAGTGDLDLSEKGRIGIFFVRTALHRRRCLHFQLMPVQQQDAAAFQLEDLLLHETIGSRIMIALHDVKTTQPLWIKANVPQMDADIHRSMHPADAADTCLFPMAVADQQYPFHLLTSQQQAHLRLLVTVCSGYR